MSLKALLDMVSTARALPAAPARATPAPVAPVAAAPGLRLLRRVLPSRGSPPRQLELDFRAGTAAPRTRGLAPLVPSTNGPSQGHDG